MHEIFGHIAPKKMRWPKVKKHVWLWHVAINDLG